MTVAICLNLQLIMSNKPTSKYDRKQMHQTGFIKHLCLGKRTRYMKDTVIINIQLFTNLFLEG